MSDSRKRYEWMEPDNVWQIGGRDTDIRNIAFCLYGRVREAYPINGVPAQIVKLLENAEKLCIAAEQAIEEVIAAVSDDLEKQKEERKCD